MTTQQHPAVSPATPAVNVVSADVLKRWLHDGAEIALLDVREHGQYGESHLFYGVNVPYSRLEIEAPRLVPNRAVRIVVYDNGHGDDVGERAALRLTSLHYQDVSVLDKGVQGWRDAGLACFAGVNLPSKTFGELAEEVYHTPRISATDLAEKLARKENLIVIDGRPFSEYQKMNIPQAVCCPNGELPLRIADIVPDPNTTIVINCAGRTRSIIGAQTLINLGIPNPVLALENGTQGWYLADLQLEQGANRRYPDSLDHTTVATQRARADHLAQRFGIRRASTEQVNASLNDRTRTTYLCDVRTPEEFHAGSVPGATHTPGGQLIQATDQYVGVRGARLVLIDTDDTRAPTVASWLMQMGWDVQVLDAGLNAKVHAPTLIDVSPVAASLPTLTAPQLAATHAAGALIIDVRPSGSFREAHIDTAVWSIRPRITTLAIDANTPVVVICDSDDVARLSAQELVERGHNNVSISIGTPDLWQSVGLTLVSTPTIPSDAESIDFLFFVHDRHSGNKAAARQYLAWETNLVHQIDEQERAAFRFPQDGQRNAI